MPLENRNLKKGTVLQARYRGKERTCDVVHTADRLRYRLDDGREFTSPSSAGKAAMNGVACNGWRFWSVEGTETPKREPKAKAERPAKAKRDAVAKKPARTKSDSYGCGVCPETFPTQKKAVAHAMTHAVATDSGHSPQQASHGACCGRCRLRSPTRLRYVHTRATREPLPNRTDSSPPCEHGASADAFIDDRSLR